MLQGIRSLDSLAWDANIRCCTLGDSGIPLRHFLFVKAPMAGLFIPASILNKIEQCDMILPEVNSQLIPLFEQESGFLMSYKLLLHQWVFFSLFSFQ